MSKTVTIRMTRDEALRQGLLICVCGFPENNHYGWGEKKCAHNPQCTGYKERARWGSVVKPKRKKKNA